MTTAKHTPLFDVHNALGARIIDFGGWRMPVQYKPGIIKEHKHVRAAIGLFDVSHMGQAWIRGEQASAAVQRLVTNHVGKMVDGAAMYTVMCYEHGGIVDDCIVYRTSEREYMIVLNASNTAKDLAWIRAAVEGSFAAEVIDRSEETALIAVQGPKAAALVDRLSDVDASDIRPFHFANIDVAGVSCMAARTGYTGEDGFELACASGSAVALWNALLDAGGADALPIGLGARDTLRLEARLSLYGNDIDATTTPYEAGLGWVVKPKAGAFIGREALLAQKAKGIEKKLVGFRVHGRGIPRHGYSILDRKREQAIIGTVTSGTKGISVSGAIGLGYVPKSHASIGNTLTIDCRGKDVQAVIIKGKFYTRNGS